MQGPPRRWRHEHAPVDGLLRRLAADELILATSGGSDWLTGSGRAEKVEGGYRVTARKIFASGSPAADLFSTMQGARYHALRGPAQRRSAGRLALGLDVNEMNRISARKQEETP